MGAGIGTSAASRVDNTTRLGSHVCQWRPLGWSMPRPRAGGFGRISGVTLINGRGGLRIGDERIERLVARHRDEPSPALRVDWGLLRLLDERHCRNLELDLADQAGEWEINRATPELHQSLPDQPGLYMFVWRPVFQFRIAEQRRSGSLYQILYIGQAGGAGNGSSNTLRGRYRDYIGFLQSEPAQMWAEPAGRTRKEVLARYLTLRPLEYWWTIVKDREFIASLEDRLIKLLNPPGNINRGPVLRPGTPQPALRQRQGE